MDITFVPNAVTRLMLYRLYRAAKRIPGLGLLVNAGLRQARGIFWSCRPAPAATKGGAPHEFVSFLESEIVDTDFTLVEIGAGDGRVLDHLAGRYPAARFIGIDLQKAAVAEGTKFFRDRGAKNIELICASCLDEAKILDCDYLISRTALIYLDSRQIQSFLRMWMPRVRRKLLLQEIVSLTDRTESSHFFANPLPAPTRGMVEFTTHVRLLDYAPWKREGAWSGANIVVRRNEPF